MRVHLTPAGLRFTLVKGDPDATELRVLAAALDRLATLERGDRPSPWASAGRPGAAPGSRWRSGLGGAWNRP